MGLPGAPTLPSLAGGGNAHKVGKDRLSGGSARGLRGAGHERGHRRFRVDRRRVERAPDEVGFRRLARHQGEVAGDLVAAPAVDLMAGEAIGFRRREPLHQLGIEARRAEGRVGVVGEDNVGRLVGPVARAGVEERGIAPIVPDQVVGAEGDMALVLAEVVDLERPVVGAGEGEKSPAALEQATSMRET